jgi:hypothetical protein
MSKQPTPTLRLGFQRPYAIYPNGSNFGIWESWHFWNFVPYPLPFIPFHPSIPDWRGFKRCPCSCGTAALGGVPITRSPDGVPLHPSTRIPRDLGPVIPGNRNSLCIQALGFPITRSPDLPMATPLPFIPFHPKSGPRTAPLLRRLGGSHHPRLAWV